MAVVTLRYLFKVNFNSSIEFIVFVKNIHYFVCSFVAVLGETNSDMFLNVL